MKILIVYAHPEPKSIDGARYSAALNPLTAAGHVLKTVESF